MNREIVYMVKCNNCGKTIPEGDYVYDGKDENGKMKWAPYSVEYEKDGKTIKLYICEDCGDLYPCEECGKLFEYDEITEISPIWQHTRKNIQNVMVCKDCADEYSVCEECGAVGLWGEKCDANCKCEDCIEDSEDYHYGIRHPDYAY